MKVIRFLPIFWLAFVLGVVIACLSACECKDCPPVTYMMANA